MQMQPTRKLAADLRREIKKGNLYGVYEIRSIHWDLGCYCHSNCVWFAYHQVWRFGFIC